MTPAIPMEAPFPSARFSTKLALAAAIAALGDWLLYGHDIGISLALFLAILAAGSFLMRPNKGMARNLWLGAALLVIALLPLMEATGFISVMFGILGTALVAVIASGGLDKGLAALANATQRLLLTGPFQIVSDVVRAKREAQADGHKWLRLDVLAGWIIPVLFCAVFAILFASANPVIDRWLAVFDPSAENWNLDIGQVFMWALLLAVAWPFISVRLCTTPLIPLRGSVKEMPVIDGNNRIFGTATILRSLVLFNLLFAVQSVLDAAYLWGGVALPQGMTYADYAHRGAYPLIATALLAAGFVLAAMRPGGAGEQSSLIRKLVYLWVGQNVLLVISSILRLDLYVDTYSLTLLRVAAFIWMLLVAIGLVLIMLRIALRRSNGWLIGANMLALALTLYACSFVNFAAVIANYNLSYKREIASGAASPDLAYIRDLGPHVIPAVDRYIARKNLAPHDYMVQWRNGTARGHAQGMADWRAWTFRDWRLQHYLDSHGDANRAKAVESGMDH